MAEVLEQISKMTHEEKIRLAHLLLDAIEHGTVVKPTAPVRKRESDDVYSYLMSQSGWLPNDYVFDREEANAK